MGGYVVKKVRYVEDKWHDENLCVTEHGLKQMRLLIIVGASLGIFLGIALGVAI